MKQQLNYLAYFSILAATLALPLLTHAQGFAGGFAADPGALNTLNSGGGGINSGFAMDRANAAAGGFPGGNPNSFDTFGGQPGGFNNAGFGAPADPAFGGGFPGGGPAFGPPGGGPAFAPQPGGFGGFGAAPVSAQPIQPQIRTLTAIYGDRVICPVTGQMLEDAVEAPVLDTFINEYSDDGKTLLDHRADDGTYTNARIVRDFMSPEAMLVKTRALRNLEILEEYKPYEFASVLVASSDPISSLPNIQELEELRDGKLEDWAQEFLERFKIDPTQATVENSIFYQSFLPDPPRTPRVQIPPSFVPPRVAIQNQKREQIVNQATGQAGQGGGGLGNLIGTNNIPQNPGASSKYF